MDRKIAGLLGVVAGLTSVGPTQAGTDPAGNGSEALKVSSYADLLRPIPNPVETLKADNAARAHDAAAQFELTQYYPYYNNPYYPPPYYPYYRDHHHHHHHHYWMGYYHHHHHHHHHHRSVFGDPGFGGAEIR